MDVYFETLLIIIVNSVHTHSIHSNTQYSKVYTVYVVVVCIYTVMTNIQVDW